MPGLMRRASARFYTRNPWQLVLAIAGIAMGVAVVVAVDLANASARQAFRLSVDAVVGRATHEIVGGPGGLDQTWYRRLTVGAGVYPASPIVEGYASAHGLTLHVLGIAPFAGIGVGQLGSRGGAAAAGTLIARPGSAWLGPRTARRLGVTRGDTLSLDILGHRQRVHITGMLTGGNGALTDGLLVTDIATAQVLFHKQGRLDRIMLRLPPGATGHREVAKIRALLPAGVRLQPTGARRHALLAMTQAFSINLSAMSLLALLIGMFLIYNTMTFSVLQRRGLIASLRALGATRGQIAGLVLGEALLLGLAGVVLGLPLGLGLGRVLVHMVTRTINDVYFVLTVNRLLISALPLAVGALLGIGATLVAASGPALEAAITTPCQAQSRAVLEGRVRRLAPRLAIAGFLVMAAAAALLLLGRSLGGGFIGVFLLIIGYTLTTPLALSAAARAAASVLGRWAGVPGYLLGRGVDAGLSRTGIAVAALTLAVAATAGVAAMIGSFRDTVQLWLAQRLRADIYVSLPHNDLQQSDANLPTGFVARVRNLPGVVAVSTGFRAKVDGAAGPTNLFAVGLVPGDQQRFVLKRGRRAAAWRAFRNDRAVLISEPYAYHHRLTVGDSLRLNTERGPIRFRVAGVYYNYASDRGVVMMRRSLYRRYWSGRAAASLGLYLAAGADAAGVQAAVQYAAGARQVLVRTNRALRRRSLRIFDRTFAITQVLRLMVMLVAFFGVLSALMALQLERVREWSVLRALGMTRRGLAGLILGQSVLMGAIAGVLALPLGTMLAAVLIFVINRRSFGWTLQFHVTPGELLAALLLATVAALLAGLYPAWRLYKLAPADGLRVE